MAMPVYEIEFDNLTFMAGKLAIIAGASMKVKKGEFVTLLGKNGSGKTTLLKLILGINKPFSGKVSIAGVPLKGSTIQKTRLKTGYVPQYFSSENDFPVNAGDVIAMGKNKKQAAIWAQKMNLEKIIHRPFGKLSGGEKQKVLLACALSREPELLLLDEPNMNLDIKAYKDFMGLVEKMKAELNLTVIFVTHHIAHIPKSCTRIAVMKDGKIIMDKAKAKILKTKNLEHIIYG